MNKAKTRVDRLIVLIKNNPIAAFRIVLGTIVIALSTFTDAARNLLGLVIEETRPAINGEWKALVISFLMIFVVSGCADIQITRSSDLDKAVLKSKNFFLRKIGKID
jgi:hypothetical protein